VSTADPAPPSGGAGSARVAAGILASRVVGFLRDRALAHYFGVGPHADVFRAALRGPNLLQNLLGEGTLSAAFIPIYSRMLAAGRREDGARYAGAVLGLLLVVAGVLVAAGVLLARPLVLLLAPGFAADAAGIEAGTAAVDRLPLAVAATRWTFPMAGLMVLAAWCLAVLNSHRRFLLPYAAPALWNAAIIGALAWAAMAAGGAGGRDRLLLAACAGALAGAGLQLAVQLPSALRLLRGFRLSLATGAPGVGEALRAFGPVVAGRGVVQLSGYLETMLASLLRPGAVAALGWAQALYVLPVSLFGMSVAAAELPELAASSARPEAVASRARAALARTAFLNLGSAVVYLVLGLPIVGALYRTGSFGVADAWLVYCVLAGYALGLPAATASRLLQNVFYALGAAAAPARIAALRVGIGVLLGLPLMLLLDRIPLEALVPGAGARFHLGPLGLALGSSLAAWVELELLRRRLRRDLPLLRLPGGEAARALGAALLAAAAAAALWALLPPLPPVAQAAVLLPVYGLAYLSAAAAWGVSEARRWVARLRD
jgi:putative peptidoglycan lipid II flippase